MDIIAGASLARPTVNLPLSVVKIGFSTSSRLALMQDAAGDLSRRRIESGQLFLPLLSATKTPT